MRAAAAISSTVGLVGAGRRAGGGELPVGVEGVDDAAGDLACRSAPPASVSSSARSSGPSRRSSRASRAAIAESDVGVADAERDLVQQPLERDGRLAVERDGVDESVSVTPTASTITNRVLGLGVGRDGLEVGVVDDADAAALHLLEVGAAPAPRA